MTEEAGGAGARGARELALRARWDRWLLFARRRRIGVLVLVVAVTTAVVLPIGRATAPGPHADARRVLEVAVLPLALDAEGIWTSGSEESPPVSEAFVAFRRDGDTRAVRDNAERWLAAYDASLVRIAGLDLPPAARPVQRQFIAAITLSRDAVEVLRHAADQDDGPLRRHLVIEAGRLRQRSEQLTQSARASVADLDRGRADVAPFADVTSLTEGST